ncbi:RNA polymerase alpha subunit (plastid) [Bigelowiella natans]|uniref:DNA-directed RNA polymerase subunit alpha n=1 Tax=Bigelowiella natans TaxID=227086 RepID=RPOA_BIGNA|nr:RNA polymerase alpha subunit [Bigelowiella natans]Q06J39.1 RecName: Full=DNA-directed RNA polymerase subunit alpha; Short=RNAP subunit alpha; AltName: Full=RNA polymerase subunit alpha; AltName: Full=Transcriptase subunit alpha [Bigelowiella natans]ABG91420.1 RNA polymerase alpha subunit [Bigelowiella natans]
MENKLFSCIESRLRGKRNYYSRFYIGPFLKNQAFLYSNVLRRVLLSDSSNIVITAVNIVGAKHEYSLLPGVRESSLDLLLNLKELVFVKDIYTKFNKSYFAYLKSNGPKIIRCSDIILPNTIYAVDSTQYIATISNNKSLILKMKLTANLLNNFYSNLNYELNSLLSYYTNDILEKTNFSLIIDPNFSCVNKVNSSLISLDNLENYNDSISLEVWTNSSYSPRIIIQNSIKSMVNLFLSIYDTSFIDIKLENSDNFLENHLVSLSNRATFFKKSFFNICTEFNTVKYKTSFDKNLTLISIDELDLSIYSKFLLKRHNILTLYDLFKIDKRVLERFYNISYKTLQSIERKMVKYGTVNK